MTAILAAVVVTSQFIPERSLAEEAGQSQDIGSAFAAKVIEATVTPGATEIPVQWDFTNRWELPLVVERFEESCGCLSGVADQGEIAPGKTGHIRATFTPGAHRGKIRKSLHVRFVGFEKPVELVAEVTIPSAVELSSPELVWEHGAELAAKTIDVKSGTGAEFSITGLLGVPESLFKINQETIVPGKHYRLEITPVGSPVDEVQCLQIRTDSSDLRDRVLAVFLRTETAPAAPAPPKQ